MGKKAGICDGVPSTAALVTNDLKRIFFSKNVHSYRPSLFKLLTEHNLEFVSLKGGFTGSSESALVKIPHCWKSHVAIQIKYGKEMSQSQNEDQPMPP